MDRYGGFLLFLCIFNRGCMTCFIYGCQWVDMVYLLFIGGWGLIRSGQGAGAGTRGVHGEAFRGRRPRAPKPLK